MKKPPATARISATDLERLQSHLRRTLGCMTLALEAPPTRNGLSDLVSAISAFWAKSNADNARAIQNQINSVEGGLSWLA